MTYRIDKLDQISRNKNIDAFLITSSISIKYLCGYFYNFETGPSPFQLIPAALFVIPHGKAILIIADNETNQLGNLDSRLSVSPYISYVYKEPLDFTTRFLAKLHEITSQITARKPRLGIESDSLPFSVSESLTVKFPGMQLVNISQELAQLRIIKDMDELFHIREATRLCDIGQEAVLRYSKPGMTELELFTLVRGEIDATAGQRVPMMADMVSGQRTFEEGGNPSSRKIEKGDLVLSDLTPCLNGYWGDTCNTIVVGKPSPEQISHFKLVEDTLNKGMDAIKPGVRANDIDRLLRKQLSPAIQYGHHSGHGVGLAYHEEPRIVPYNEIELLPGMVIALEPAIYTNGYGIRLEHLVMVTLSGCEKISGFDHRLI